MRPCRGLVSYVGPGSAGWVRLRPRGCLEESLSVSWSLGICVAGGPLATVQRWEQPAHGAEDPRFREGGDGLRPPAWAAGGT